MMLYLYHPILVSLLLLAAVLTTTRAEWTPQSRFWKHVPQNLTLLENDGKEQVANVQSCFQLAKTKILRPVQDDVAPDDSDSSKQPKIVNQVVDSETKKVILVEIESAISQFQTTLVKLLSECIQIHLDEFQEHRSFDIRSGGGNDATFLTPLLLPMLLPEIAGLIQEIGELAYDHGNWNTTSQSDNSDNNSENHHHLQMPPIGSCGLRTSEFLDYGQFKSLGTHIDADSLYTVIFALTDPADYQGGEYYIEDSTGVRYLIRPQQFSALVFLSDQRHGVMDITGGVRQMFANEYWALDDPPFPLRRPDPDRMTRFTVKCDTLFGPHEHCTVDPWEEDDQEDPWEEDEEEEKEEEDKQEETEEEDEQEDPWEEDEQEDSWEEDEEEETEDCELSEETGACSETTYRYG